MAKTTVKKGWYYRLSFQKKTSLWGIIFLLPWILGFAIFFIKPLIEVVIYSFNDVKLGESGGLVMSFTGIDNYVRALTIDPKFNEMLLTTIVTSIPTTFLIIIFSLLSGILLNGKFRGRMIARGIFFIPIIMAAGLVVATVGGATSQVMQGGQGEAMLGTSVLTNMLMESGFPKEFISAITGSVSSIFSVITLSGVQILIFLAGLQAISPSLYEVARIEGATGYETFWKVTFPMVSPLILTVSIYSLADAFLRSDITDRIYEIAFKESRYGLSASMSVIFLVATLLIMGIVSFLISRKVFYYD